MNEFQLGLKLQLSGVDAAETMLNGFTKSLDQQLAGIKGFTKQLGQGNDTVRGYIDSAKKMIEQNPIGETMGKLSGLAKTLGLDQVATGIAQTGNSVRAWTGELTSFLGSAQGASATIKQVLQGDVNGAISSVKTGLTSLGSMADLANKMGLPGVATGIKDIAANVGTWVGKVQEFQGATEATAAKLNTVFGGSIHPNVLKVTSGLMEMTGVSKDILPHLDGMVKQFESLTGKSFPEAFKGMQDLSKEFGNGGISANKLGEALKFPGGPAKLLAGGLGIVGAAIAGWQIGKAIGDMDLFGVKINDVAQYSIAKAMQGFEKFKRWLHITTEEEYQRNSKAYGDTAEQLALNQPAQKGGGTGAANPQAAATTNLETGETLKALQTKLAAEESAQKQIDEIRQESHDELLKQQEEYKDKLAEIEKLKAEAIKAAQDNAKTESDENAKKMAQSDEQIAQLKKENALLLEQAETLKKLQGKPTDLKLKKEDEGKRDPSGKLKKGLKHPGAVEGDSAEGNGENDGKGKKGNKSKDDAEKVLTLSQQIQQTFDDIANSGIKSVQDSITGLIKGTMTWKDALSHVGTTVLDSLMSGFMKMVQTQITGLFTVDAAKDKISMGARIRNMAEALSNMPNALLSSITSWGAAATIGLAAVTAAMSAFGGFESGGYTGDGGRSEVAGLVHRGEMVFDQPAVQAIGKDRLEAMRMNRAMPTGLAGAGTGGGGGKAMTPNINVQAAQPKVIVVNSQEELMRVMKGSIGEEITVAHIAKNKLRLGMAS